MTDLLHVRCSLPAQELAKVQEKLEALDGEYLESKQELTALMSVADDHLFSVEEQEKLNQMSATAKKRQQLIQEALFTPAIILSKVKDKTF